MFESEEKIFIKFLYLLSGLLQQTLALSQRIAWRSPPNKLPVIEKNARPQMKSSPRPPCGLTL